MNITTSREKLLDAIILSERIVGKKESLPVLSCVRFEVNKFLSVQATNLEAGIEVIVPGDVSEKGIIAIPVSVLSQTLRAISGDKVMLTAEDGNLLVQSRGTKTLIKAIPHEEFPSIGSERGAQQALVGREELLSGLQAVLYAASPSMIRPELGSVYVVIDGKRITCVATDSFRLAEKTISSLSGKGDAELLIPLKHALELSHILERLHGAEVSLSADDAQMHIESDGVRYMSRIVDAQFPNYREIIPKSFTTEATLLKADLAETLKKARVFSGNDQHVGLHVYPGKKICTATARSAEVGEMSDSIDAALSGEDIDINFHIGYLADCLSSIESDSITLSFSGPGRPLVVRGVSDPQFTYLVMPLNR